MLFDHLLMYGYILNFPNMELEDSNKVIIIFLSPWIKPNLS